MHHLTILTILTLSACKGADDPDSIDTPVGTIDPTCVDGQWTETLPNPDADLSELLDNYDDMDPAGFLEAALDLRYPTGAYLFVEGMRSDAFDDNCLEFFTQPSDLESGEAMLDVASLLVHECGHFLDLELRGFGEAAYALTQGTILTCETIGFEELPARSKITDDSYSALRPPCSEGDGEFGCDIYADIYLDGDFSDGQFDSGDQLFEMLHEETVQYINSLATDYAFADRLGEGTQISSRDGILTFLWYTSRYLKYSREEFAGGYQAIIESPCWREAVLTVWGRAWMYVGLTEGDDRLGLDDDVLLQLATDPVLLQEIQLIRDAHGCITEE